MIKTWDLLTVGDKLVKKTGEFAWSDEIKVLARSGDLIAFRSHVGNIVWQVIDEFKAVYDIVQSTERTEPPDPKNPEPGFVYIDLEGRISDCAANTYYLILSGERDEKGYRWEWRAARFSRYSDGWLGAPVVHLWQEDIDKLKFVGVLMGTLLEYEIKAEVEKCIRNSIYEEICALGIEVKDDKGGIIPKEEMSVEYLVSFLVKKVGGS